jgi:hypothetical protein
MAASTITRTTWTNDTGTPTSPVGDGTLINNARLQDIYAAIDQLFSGGGSYATLTFGGLVAVEGFGVSNFSAGGTGANVIGVRNTTSGTGNYAEVRAGNNATATLMRLKALSSAFTTSGYDVASGVTVEATGSGGLNLAASDASGPFRLFTGGTTQRYAIDSTGVHTYLNSTVTSIPMAAGSAAAPSVTFQTDADTGMFRSGSDVIGFAAGGVVRAYVSTQTLGLSDMARGTGGVGGPLLAVGRNTSGAGAAGCVALTRRDGTMRYLWVDVTGNLLVHTAQPTEDNSTVSDTAGTVVGTQTSTRATKRAIAAFDDYRGALALIARTPLYRFQYRDFDPDTPHVGIMADESPEFTRYQGTAFDPVNAFGYTAAAIKALLQRVGALEAALAARG